MRRRSWTSGGWTAAGAARQASLSSTRSSCVRSRSACRRASSSWTRGRSARRLCCERKRRPFADGGREAACADGARRGSADRARIGDEVVDRDPLAERVEDAPAHIADSGVDEEGLVLPHPAAAPVGPGEHVGGLVVVRYAGTRLRGARVPASGPPGPGPPFRGLLHGLPSLPVFFAQRRLSRGGGGRLLGAGRRPSHTSETTSPTASRRDAPRTSLPRTAIVALRVCPAMQCTSTESLPAKNAAMSSSGTPIVPRLSPSL